MGKAEFGTAKYISKQLKAKGLQKLRFYCQVCKKQCRDANGFRSHIRSPHHLKMIASVTQEDIEKFSILFEKDFLYLLQTAHGEKRIEANKFYNEFIQDKNHIHMNATTFTSLTKFIKHLGKKGKIKVYGQLNDNDNQDMDKVYISYIDNSQSNFQQNKRIEEFEKQQKTHQEVNKYLLEKQIAEGEKIKRSNKINNKNDNDKAAATIKQDIKIDENISLTFTTPTLNSESKVKKRKSKKKVKNVFD